MIPSNLRRPFEAASDPAAECGIIVIRAELEYAVDNLQTAPGAPLRVKWTVTAPGPWEVER